ncbi:Gtr1 raga G protein Gtr2 [Boletus edulis]|nr:Gtr1 raga G protein Gtr2 [Boletus edulis]
MSPPQRQQEAYLKLAKPQQKNDPLHRSKILLLGTRRFIERTISSRAIIEHDYRSGKTSILQVLFKNLPSKQTFYLEPTMRVTKHPYDTLIPLEIWDCPGNITVDTLGAPLSEFASIVFVIDIRDLYQQPVVKLVEFIVAACQVNPNINLEVFVHKAEKLQEDDKIENFRQIHERVMDRLVDESPEYEQVPLNFHLTSVYDYTLQEAFSRVIHKLIDSLPYLENLLNVFCSNTSSPKAFLFDTTSKLYRHTTSACDYLQMLNSFGPLYKSNAPPQADTPDSAKPSTKAPFYPSASTSLSPSQPVTLTYHLVTPHLALMRRGLVEWNVVWFREGVREIWEVEKERSEGELV